MTAALVLVLASALLGTATGIGARRRGRGLPAAVLHGALFPLTWTAWYVVDERPYRRGS